MVSLLTLLLLGLKQSSLSWRKWCEGRTPSFKDWMSGWGSSATANLNRKRKVLFELLEVTVHPTPRILLTYEHELYRSNLRKEAISNDALASKLLQAMILCTGHSISEATNWHIVSEPTVTDKLMTELDLPSKALSVFYKALHSSLKISESVNSPAQPVQSNINPEIASEASPPMTNPTQHRFTWSMILRTQLWSRQKSNSQNTIL